VRRRPGAKPSSSNQPPTTATNATTGQQLLA
jgi:hypothetical protein